MYKLPLKIAGIIISVVLFIMAVDIGFYNTSGHHGAGFDILVDKTYRDYPEYEEEAYFFYNWQDDDPKNDKILIENDIDRAMLEVQISKGEEIASDTDRTVDCLGEAFSYLFGILGAIVFVLSLCIKTPFDEKLINKIKSKKKSNKKSNRKRKDRFCRICGEEISETARFCPVCGSDTATAEISPTTSSDSSNYQ